MTVKQPERVELAGMVVSEPRLVDDDWLFWLETGDSWYQVILSRGKRWLKQWVEVRVSGVLKDDTLLASTCKRVK